MVYHSNDLPKELLTLFKIFCLFIWLNQFLVAAHGIFFVACRIFHAGARVSVVVARVFSCPTACGILVP